MEGNRNVTPEPIWRTLLAFALFVAVCVGVLYAPLLAVR